MAGKRKQTTTEDKPAAKRATRASKKTDEAPASAPKKAQAAGWDFLKAPKGDQLKKPAKKAAAPVADAEFPALADNDLKAFDGIIPEPSSSAQYRVLAWYVVHPCYLASDTAGILDHRNVNGLRAVLKKDNYFRAYIAREDPDVLCLSETKIDDASLGAVRNILPQYEHQYWKCATQKGIASTTCLQLRHGLLSVGYSGTAMFSKTKPLSVLDEIVVDGQVDDEGRFLALEFDNFWVVHTYVQRVYSLATAHAWLRIGAQRRPKAGPVPIQQQRAFQF